MQYRLLLPALAASAYAYPNELHIRQGVTAVISKTGTAAGCSPTYAGTFGIAVMNVTSASGTAAVTSLPDGQPGAGTAVMPISVSKDGQPEVVTMTMGRISMITDGQIQAPVTHAAMTVTPVSQISDGQIQATAAATATPVKQITDGQIQASTAAAPKSAVPVSQIGDGQIQATTAAPKPAAPVSQIGDGQIQATAAAPKSAAPVSQIGDGQIQATTAAAAPKSAAPVSQIGDGQIQATTAAAAPVSQLGDGQINGPKASAAPVAQIGDGQLQNPSPVAQMGDGQITSRSLDKRAMMGLVGCASNDSLALTLANGVLKDSHGRTGYIASNYQFQFDNPPQAGALYTAGFSVCGNGTLALGGSSIFYQCLSGSFYNLYDRKWAAQCNPVYIDTLMLEMCS